MKKAEKSAFLKRNPFLKSPHPAQRAAFSTATNIPDLLDDFKGLSTSQKKTIVDQARLLFEGYYVHRPLKEAMHAVQPVQALAVLRQRLTDFDNDLDFHAEMTRIFSSVKDLHTNYTLPKPFGTMRAVLPFLVERFCDGKRTGFLVTRLLANLADGQFKPGVEIIDWNGAPINRYVDALARLAPAGNAAAAAAHAEQSLTTRWLGSALPPDETWVVIGYLGANGERREIRQEWILLSARDGLFTGSDGQRGEMGLDIEQEVAFRSRALLFAPGAVEIGTKKKKTGKKREKKGVKPAIPAWMKPGASRPDWPELATTKKRALVGPDGKQMPWSVLKPKQREQRAAAGDIGSSLPKVLAARVVSNRHGAFGYIRIRTFVVGDLGQFLREFLRLLALLPREGLILDVRDNGGGWIAASEVLLQLLTPRSIQPARFQFISTPETRDLCDKAVADNNTDGIDLSRWRESVQLAVQTGADFSLPFNLTSLDLANRFGQVYHGPVVLITNGRCYSATDMFAAGFKDHEIGPIIGVDANTGAGGANVWEHDLLTGLAHEVGAKSGLKKLPREAAMRVSIRRTLRVGALAGTPLEDLGVQPDIVRCLTRDDLLHGNRDLLLFASGVLAGLPVFRLDARRTATQLRVETAGLDRLDVYLQGRPIISRDLDGDGPLVIRVQAADDLRFELRGFRQGRLAGATRV